MPTNKHILEGKVIEGVFLLADQTAIRFKTPEGYVTAWCDGDCCSYTWIEHVEMPALGLPATVTKVEYLYMPDRVEDTDLGVVEHYGFSISTDKGSIVIDYRNASNGFYGGYLVWPEDQSQRHWEALRGPCEWERVNE